MCLGGTAYRSNLSCVTICVCLMPFYCVFVLTSIVGALVRISVKNIHSVSIHKYNKRMMRMRTLSERKEHVVET